VVRFFHGRDTTIYEVTNWIDAVSYASFGDEINTKYHNEVASLSTNTGGVCQFYQ
jgi:hypothetical protein